jgi:predicted component of type VI protein secretion system
VFILTIKNEQVINNLVQYGLLKISAVNTSAIVRVNKLQNIIDNFLATFQ